MSWLGKILWPTSAPHVPLERDQDVDHERELTEETKRRLHDIEEEAELTRRRKQHDRNR